MRFAESIRAVVSMIVLLQLRAAPVCALPLQLPATGQTACFSEGGTNVSCRGSGQDAESHAGAAWPSPRFVPAGEIYTDALTGLSWAKYAAGAGSEFSCYPAPQETRMTWEQAFSAIECLNARSYQGFSDWRVPNVNEMESLVSAQDPGATEWLGQQGFVGADTIFWTATTSPADSSLAFQVNYYMAGSVSPAGKLDKNCVWPVRGGSSLAATGQTQKYHEGDDGALRAGAFQPEPRFAVQGSCVSDNLTGVMWTKSADLTGRKSSWSAALTYAKSFRGCGYGGWRVPNRRELLSLLNHGKADSAAWLNSVGFSGVHKDSGYWSSTSYAYQPNSAWKLQFSDGGSLFADVKPAQHSALGYVWLVRLPQAGDGQIQRTPVLLSPKNNALVKTPAVTLKWQAAVGALLYKVSISSDGKRFLSAGKSAKTSQRLTKLRRNKTYSWRVQAVTAAEASPWSSAWKFRVR